MGELTDSMYDYRPEREEPEAIASCDGCGQDFYEGDYAYRLDGVLHCEDCVECFKELIVGDD